jgi:RNA polymerase sigma-70 factor (ECF subfamily)
MPSVPSNLDLERFRSTLELKAHLLWSPRLQGRFEPSDLVQDTFLQAHKKRAQYQGNTDAELAAWLLKILIRKIANAYRWWGRDRRDVNLEQSLEAKLGETSSRLQGWLAADQSTPSSNAAKEEHLSVLADSLTQLLPDQRQAVILHHLQGLSLAEVARVMGCTEPAVAGLLRRGLQKLRELMPLPE